MVFCGKSRPGKSALITPGKSLLITSILTNRRIHRNVIHNIVICIPKHSFSLMSEKDNPFLALDKERCMILIMMFRACLQYNNYVCI